MPAGKGRDDRRLMWRFASFYQILFFAYILLVEKLIDIKKNIQ